MAVLGVFMKHLFIFLVSTLMLAQVPVIDGTKLLPTMGPSIQYGPGWTNALKNLLPLQNFHQKRPSFIMTVIAPEGDCDIKDIMNNPSGFKSYRFNVLAKQTVTFKLNVLYKANFRLFTVNKWGDLEEGMLQNLIQKGEPQASYISPKDTTNIIYLIVTGDSSWTYWEPYTVEVRYTQK